MIRIDEGPEMQADIRYRGASSLQYQKKSFAVKLKDAAGNKRNVSLLGMRSDNSWILDAMTIDKSRMRNRVSTDLWLDFSRRLYYSDREPLAVNGTRGQYVEVYLNGEYYGLFCLTEKVDRKQLKLKKCTADAVRGLLYKATGYCSMWIQDEKRYVWDNDRVVWDNGWELKYPDLSADEPIDWEPLVNIIRWLNTSSHKEFHEEIESRIDLPVWVDYFLLVDLMLGDDNAAKNMYVSFYDLNTADCRLAVTPWDMDATWGRNYKSLSQAASTETELHHQIHSRLMISENAAADIYGPRYAELRNTFFSASVLKSYFKRYFDLFKATEAGRREESRWSGVDGIVLDLDAEEDYIYNWIDERLAFLDMQYNYNDDASRVGIPSVESSSMTYPVYSVSGQCVGTVAEPTYEKLYSLHPKAGLYLIGRKKFIVR